MLERTFAMNKLSHVQYFSPDIMWEALEMVDSKTLSKFNLAACEPRTGLEHVTVDSCGCSN
ncbi:hypothetical protein BIY23_04555 [Wolbachia pipientis]|uniref:Uncharacterized protein n=2 Tax=Wolbachia pipientis TaxID=955 RepID=A0A1E7QK75_WOLPI|nr:hypothetical protein BIY23_04555 [Wolbachia pipientis]